MSRRPDNPPLLRRQLLGWLLIPLCVLLAADSFVSYWFALEFACRAHDRALAEVARDLSLHLGGQGGTLQLDLPPAARQLLFSDPSDKVYFEVATAAGVRVEGVDIAPPPASNASGAPLALYEGEMEGEPVRIAQMQASASGARPAALVRVAETKNKRNELAREILASVILPQVLLILIAGVLVWAGVVLGLRPLETMRLAVNARSARNWSPPPLADVPGEVRPLLESINELMASLDAALSLQSRFIGDAAHQLKTPLAALETQLEVALRENDPARLRDALNKARAGVGRLSRVVSQLLSLARNEPEAAHQIAMQSLDLNALALQVSTDWVSEALKKRIDLGFEGAGAPVTLLGDTMRLRELCDNLIDNAIRYSGKGGRVTVCVQGAPNPSLSVSDDSPRIPIEERGRIFERFHRLLGNRSEGSGLGLAIVKEIAHLHGATVSLQDDTDGVGHTFTVSFGGDHVA